MKKEFDIGNAIKVECTSRRIKQADLAKEFRVSQAAISSIFCKNHINTKKLCEICEYLEIQPSKLVKMAEESVN